jgi:hypothetical protein
MSSCMVFDFHVKHQVHIKLDKISKYFLSILQLKNKVLHILFTIG